jgi:hypothetical protein
MQIEEEDKEFLIVKGISRILHEQNPFESEPPLIEWCGVQVDRFDARTLLNSPLDLNSSSSFGQTSQQSKTLTYSNLKEKQQEQDEERLCDIERYQDLDSFSTSSSRTFSLTEGTFFSEFIHIYLFIYIIFSYGKTFLHFLSTLHFNE